MLNTLRRWLNRATNRDLRDELQFHLDSDASLLHQQRLSSDVGRAEPERRLGDLDRRYDELQDGRGGRWLAFLVQDVRLALRLMRRLPFFAATVMLTVALGVGANTAIFSAVDAVVLRPLPFVDADRLVSLWGTNPDKSITRFSVSYPDFSEWKVRSRSFDDMALYSSALATMVGPDGAESVAALSVTSNFLELFGMKPIVGRGFGPEDERGESSNAVLLSYGFWQRRFGGDRAAVGRTISVNGRPRSIIGVLPPDADLFGTAYVGTPVDVVSVIELSTFPRVERHTQHVFGAFGRLRPGVTLVQAREDLLRVQMQVSAEFPEVAGWTASVFPISDDLSFQIKEPLFILLGASVLLLMIACINVANLLLVRAAVRTREMAVRQALGASRARLVAQIVTECVLLALGGGTLGIALGDLTIHIIARMLPYGLIPRDLGLDARVVLFAVILSTLSALAFGIWPAARARHASLCASLRERASSSGVSRGTQRTLVVVEVALALVLVVCAGLVLRSVRRMLRVDPGFNPSHVVTAAITLGPRYADSAGVGFYRMLLADLESRPGVEAASATNTPPLTGTGSFTPIRLIGQPLRPPNAPLMSTVRVVAPGYFKAMGMHILDGRDIDWTDASPSLIVSSAAARTFWSNVAPVGQQIAFNSLGTTAFPIAGVVNDTRDASLALAPAPIIYMSIRRSSRVPGTMTLVVRGRGDISAIVSEIRSSVTHLDPTLALYNVRTMQSIVDQSTAQQRLNLTLLSLFGAAALLLAALGIYGVISYSVAQRRQEIGVRMTLGAQRVDVLKLVLSESTALAATGIIVGVVASLFATRLIQSWLFEVGPSDPLTLTGVSVGFAGVATVASLLPALRAVRIDPVRAMRAD